MLPNFLESPLWPTYPTTNMQKMSMYNLDNSVPSNNYALSFSKRGKPKLQYNGHCYRPHNKPSKRYSTWRCYYDWKYNCFARVKIELQSGLLILTNVNHNHDVPN